MDRAARERVTPAESSQAPLPPQRIEQTIDANGSANSTVFAMDGFLQEPRGIEIVPTDPLTGN